MFNEIPRSRLRVISAVLTNLGAGFLLSPFAARDASVLTGSLIIAILCLRIAEYIEEGLNNL